MSDSSPVRACTHTCTHTDWVAAATAAVFAEKAQSSQFLVGSHGEESKQSRAASSWSLGEQPASPWAPTCHTDILGVSLPFLLRVSGLAPGLIVWATPPAPWQPGCWPLTWMNIHFLPSFDLEGLHVSGLLLLACFTPTFSTSRWFLWSTKNLVSISPKSLPGMYPSNLLKCHLAVAHSLSLCNCESLSLFEMW